MSALLENGQYDAVVKKAVLTQSKSDNLMVVFELLLGGAVERRHWASLTKNNGKEINETKMKILQEIFTEWNGDDPSWFEEESNILDVQCVADVENHKDGNGTEWSNVVNIHVEGTSEGDSTLPQSIDKKTLQAKYGAKFRAFAGKSGKTGKTVRPRAQPTAAGTEDKPADEDNTPY